MLQRRHILHSEQDVRKCWLIQDKSWMLWKSCQHSHRSVLVCAISSPCGRMPTIFLFCLQHTINSLHLLNASLCLPKLCLFCIIRGRSESELHVLRSQLNSASMLPRHCSTGFFLLRNRTRQGRNVQILVRGMKSQGAIKKNDHHESELMSQLVCRKTTFQNENLVITHTSPSKVGWSLLVHPTPVELHSLLLSPKQRKLLGLVLIWKKCKLEPYISSGVIQVSERDFKLF